eukprot:TRINITY_DN19131_c0_g1_i1.p1 TRINITY_DN19131_c0_g1~~TRINITY_DN19131_c0_g1_i1.p1  ORF type:complete len:568 (+),score=63.59 TRINITY_DN19131_c0_g1_i1:125-1828(+)
MLKRTISKLTEKVPFWRINREKAKSDDARLLASLRTSRSVQELVDMVGQADERGPEAIVKTVHRLARLVKHKGSLHWDHHAIFDIVESAHDKMTYTPRLIPDSEMLNLTDSMLQVRQAFRLVSEGIQYEIFTLATQCSSLCLAEIYSRKLSYHKVHSSRSLYLISFAAHEGVHNIDLLSELQKNVKGLRYSGSSLFLMAAAESAGILTMGFCSMCYDIWIREGFNLWKRSHIIFANSLLARRLSREGIFVVRQIFEELCIRGVITPGLSLASVRLLLHSACKYKVFSSGLINGLTMNVLDAGFKEPIDRSIYTQILGSYCKLNLLHSAHNVVIRKFSKDVKFLIKNDEAHGIDPLRDFKILGLCQIVEAYHSTSMRDDFFFNVMSRTLLSLVKNVPEVQEAPQLVKGLAFMSYASLPVFEPMLSRSLSLLEKENVPVPTGSYFRVASALGASGCVVDARHWERLESIALRISLRSQRPQSLIGLLNSFAVNSIKAQRLADKVAEYFRHNPSLFPTDNLEQFLNSYKRMNLPPPFIPGLNNQPATIFTKRQTMDKPPRVIHTRVGTDL